MKLVFLYGPPAVGKYTIGVELAAQTGFRLFHNHLTVNLVSAVFERDSDVWLRMLRSVRRDVLTEAARNGVDLIMTGVFRARCDACDRLDPLVHCQHEEGHEARADVERVGCGSRQGTCEVVHQ